MATARLYKSGGVYLPWSPRSAWRVGAEVERCREFPGPETRNWDRFTLTDDGATFEWRSGNEQIRRLAGAFSRGEISVEHALTDSVYADWVHDTILAERGDPDEGYFAYTPDAEAAMARKLLTSLAPLVTDDSSAGAYAHEPERRHLHAARALDLPPWARVETVEYYAADYRRRTLVLLVLGDGRALADLSVWLAERAA